MASRAAKDVPVSEKRGKSPSNLRHTDPAQRRKSPHPPSLDHHQKPVSASDHKNAPNYLRPTVSSRTDTSKNNSATKKPSTTTCTTDTAHKSTINRRRSLDNKPPPPNSHLPKTHSTSPTPVEKNPRPTLSTKAKPTSTITKPLPEKAAKAFSKDVGKPHSLYSRPVKNVKKNTTSTASASAGAGAGASNSTTKKLNSTSTNALATKAPISTSDHSANIEDTPKHEPLQEDIEPSVTEPEEEELASNERSNNGLPTEVLILEDKEHVDIPPAEVHQPEEIEESEEEVKKLSNSSTVLEKQHTTPVPEEKNTNHVVEMEETEPEEIHIDGPEIEDKEVEEESKDENDHNNHQEEESFESEPIAVVNNKKKNEGGEHSGIQEKPEEKGLEEKEEVKDEGKKGSEAEYDTKKVEEVSKEVKPEAKEVKAEVKELRPEVKEVKPEEANKINLVSRPQGSKKDNTAYNDVIEETASKLREQRRNKVKALVGAFETVISLEDPEAETPRGN